MSDPLGDALQGLANGSVRGLPLAALAGVATSIGPCVAPRYLALTALIGEHRPLGPILAFIAGITLVSVALGSAVSALATAVANVSLIDALLAIGLIAAGLLTLLREPHACAAGTHAPPAARSHAPRARCSGAFALGAGSALVVSPCCTPFLAAFAGFGAFDRDPLLASSYLVAFALGHAAPLALAGVLGGACAAHAHRVAASAAPAIVSGTLMLALGAYYGLLA